MMWPNWIELVFRVDPHEAHGSLERAVAIFVPAVALILSAIATLEWRRGQPIGHEPDR
jgi:hypothetical protein